MDAHGTKALRLLLPGLLVGVLPLLAQDIMGKSPQVLALENPQMLQTAGIFYPMTEEYLRQRTKKVPYEVSSAALPEAKKIRVFEYHSPLELALLSEERFPVRKESRRFPLWQREAAEGWRPLSKEEWQDREKELAEKAVEMGAELADSLSMPYFSNSLLWTTERFNAYRDHLAEQYRLHFKFSDEDAFLSYHLTY